MKQFAIFLLCLLSGLALAHNPQDNGQAILRHWTLAAQNKDLEGFFLMYKAGKVFIEQADHAVVNYPLSAFSEKDQSFVLRKYEQIRQLNNQSAFVQQSANGQQTVFDYRFWIAGLLLALLGYLFFSFAERGKRKYLYPVLLVGVVAFLYSFNSSIRKCKVTSTDPAFIDSAFIPFKPDVYTHWDADYFYVESKGIPHHQMMTGITGWQQQVPIPQCYIGNNAWSIPLNPVIAPTPVPVSPQHFIRGAIAIAANGVPIFNPFTNTGVDAFLDGQLDIFGGHCGRGDDYHYHIAPLQLDPQTPDILPIAFALDGFAVYGSLEPDGSPMSPLDSNHGHYGTNGVYHYHGTPNAPYMIGNMVGVVTEDNTMQIIPQAHANPIRPAQTPLQGAVITDCQPNGTNNGYTLTYTKGGQTYYVQYSWTPAGQYTFNFISPTGTTMQTYNGFTQCQVPTAVNDAFGGDPAVTIYPNPAHSGFSVVLNAQVDPTDVQSISIFTVQGALVYRTSRYQQAIEVKDLKKGIYLVNIQLPGKEISQKLMVQ